jgi:hypothetical protein
MSGTHLSRDFFDLVKAIGECRSKQEEDKIIENETIMLKSKFADTCSISDPKKFKEYLLRSVYVEMLGHDASTFAYIHAVNMCHTKHLIAKRVGYLVSSLFLNPSSELMILLINTIQKDLKSSNILEISFALIMVSKLANLEMVPVLMSLIQPLLSHVNELVRRRALIAFHRLVQIDDSIDPGLVQQVVRRALADPDPSVMGAALNMVYEIASNFDPEGRSSIFQDLVPSLVAIQKQILEYKLPKDYEYHRLPAPWIQIKLVQIFGLLGESNQEISSLLYEVLSETMRRCDIMSNAGAGLIYEVIKTSTKIKPYTTLLEHCSLYVSKFLNSDNYNYKYLGVTSLSLMVSVNPAFANEHQVTVVDCLEDADETLKRRTMDLLFKMTNHNNVEIVVERLLAHLAASDTQAKSDLCVKICSLAEQFAPSNQWFLETINMVYMEAGSGVKVPETVGHNLIRLIAEQEGGEDDLRTIAANGYIRLLEKFLGESEIDFSTDLLKVMIWVVGEYATIANLEGYTVDDVLDLLIDGMKREQQRDDTNHHLTESFITAIAKVGVHASETSKIQILQLFSDLEKDKTVKFDVRRRCREYTFVLKRNEAKTVLPFDASCEDIQIDLRNFDTFVAENKIGRVKSVSKQVAAPVVFKNLAGLRFDAYEAPKPVTVVSSVSSSPKLIPISSGSVTPFEQPVVRPQVTKQRWGPGGYQGPTISQPSSVVEQPVIVKQPAVTNPPPSIANEKILEKQKMARALFTGVRNERVVEQPPKAPSPDRKESDLLNFD